MKENILIAGGTGLVGSNLVNGLAETGLSFIATSYLGDPIEENDNFTPYDFCRFEDCLSATKDKNAVVLCAALSYGAKKNKELPTGAILPNLQMTAGLLEAASRNKVSTVVMLSTSTVYQQVSSPIREDDLDLNQPPYAGYFGVGWTYRYLEQLVRLYIKTYGMKIAILRPTNIYGPFDKFEEERAHVIPSLIRRTLNRENPFEVWGSPNVVRDFVFVDDVVADIIAILKGEVDLRNLPVNICSGKPMTIKEAAEIILETCAYKTEVYFNTQKPSGTPYQAIDNLRYLELFGNRKRTAFREGIEKTVIWYKTHSKPTKGL